MRVTIKVDPELKRATQWLAERTETTVTAMFREFIREGCASFGAVVEYYDPNADDYDRFQGRPRLATRFTKPEEK